LGAEVRKRRLRCLKDCRSTTIRGSYNTNPDLNPIPNPKPNPKFYTNLKLLNE